MTNHVITPVHTATSLNKVQGYSRVSILGRNASVPNTGADIWEGGGFYPFLSTASTLEVLSSSANDTAAGTGARTVLVSGLNSAYGAISEVVTLNGTTPIATVNSYLRVNLFTTVTSGSEKINAGTLTLRVAGAGSTQSVIATGYGYGRTAVYTPPIGYQLLIDSIYFSIVQPAGNQQNSCVCALFNQSSAGNQRFPMDFTITSTVPYRHDALTGIPVASQADFAIRCTSTAQTGTSIITAAAEGLLVPFP